MWAQLQQVRRTCIDQYFRQPEKPELRPIPRRLNYICPTTVVLFDPLQNLLRKVDGRFQINCVGVGILARVYHQSHALFFSHRSHYCRSAALPVLSWAAVGMVVFRCALKVSSSFAEAASSRKDGETTFDVKLSGLEQHLKTAEKQLLQSQVSSRRQSSHRCHKRRWTFLSSAPQQTSALCFSVARSRRNI